MLDGTWIPLAGELDGEDLPPSLLESIRLVIDQGAWQVNEDRGLVTMDERSDPASLDVVGTVGPNAGKTIFAIFRFEGDELVISYEMGSSRRPESFVTGRGSHLLTIRYRRA